MPLGKGAAGSYVVDGKIYVMGGMESLVRAVNEGEGVNAAEKAFQHGVD
ncbi:hypothetical protein GF312_10195 [Candidatus Poribacteria bacterium]|nr:hypothetical protein [Candidatus Poribacteria bacterium]